jgi:hypothetical protein
MATYNKFNAFVADLANGVHNFASDQISVALTAAANAPVAGNSVLADLTTVALTNLASANVTTTSSTQTSGTYSLVLVDPTLTASGGSVGPFQYIVFYNNSAAGDPLIAWYDYGSEITLADGESLAVNIDTTNNRLFTLA